MLRRFNLFLAACACFVVTAGAASAAPSNANTFIIPTTCGTTPVELAVIGEGSFSPGHVVGSTSVFIPYTIDVVTTFTPEDGGEPTIESEHLTKPAPAEGVVTCTISFTTTFPGEGTVEISGSVTGFFTPR
jgi:hypothetical protein